MERPILIATPLFTLAIFLIYYNYHEYWVQKLGAYTQALNVETNLKSDQCLCTRNNSDVNRSGIGNYSVASTCSSDATAFGPGQKVISYVFYVNNDDDTDRYLKGLIPNLEAIPILYPGWVVRIYTDVSAVLHKVLCHHFCKFTFLFLCDITNIPVTGNMSNMIGRTWRFLVLGDPLVDIFLVRDLDSRLTLRERLAVAEWEESKYSFHVMRDHQFHLTPILGGMWGGQNRILGTLAKTLQKELIQTSMAIGGKDGVADQNVLKYVVYTTLCNDTMAHDSYFCGDYPDGVHLPFPVQRLSPADFVGNVVDVPSMKFEAGTCPEKCRKNKNWMLC